MSTKFVLFYVYIIIILLQYIWLMSYELFAYQCIVLIWLDSKNIRKEKNYFFWIQIGTSKKCLKCYVQVFFSNVFKRYILVLKMYWILLQ